MNAPPSIWVVVFTSGKQAGELYPGGHVYPHVEGAEGALRRAIQRDMLTVVRYDLAAP